MDDAATSDSARTAQPSDYQGRLAREVFGPYLGEVNVNVGCGGNIVPGFLNMTRDQWDLGLRMGTDIPPDGSVDCIMASHVMEHVDYMIDAMREIHAALRPGGHFIAITPHAASDAAVEDPTHVRSFTERSWFYFNRTLYETPGHAGHYDSPVDFSFGVVRVDLVPYKEFWNDPELDHKKKHWRNVIREVHAVLRKI